MNRRIVFLMAVLVSFFLPLSFIAAQVGPAEIRNPRLKSLEQQHLQDLVALHQSISELKFPFQLSLNRYVGLDPKDQIGTDARGLEFVLFHERELLKLTANYNAAFNTGTLTPNQRAGRVLSEVILPVLRLLPNYFSQKDSFSGFGFEIGYHVITHKKSYQYEGKEILVAVFDKADGLQYGLSQEDQRQLILNRSDIYLNGEPIGLALGSSTPLDLEALVRRPSSKSTAPIERASVPTAPKSEPPAQAVPVKSSEPPPATSAKNMNLDVLRDKYQSEIDVLHREGIAKFQFVDYAPPSFVLIRDQPALQATLRNPDSYDRESTSIYRRAARTFDLFLAPRLKWIVSKVPDAADFSMLDLSIVNELTSAKSERSSEAIEFIFPLNETRQFAAAEITNQDLIDRSIVLVNGVRIALNLAQVE